jgi:hypothetical protein
LEADLFFFLLNPSEILIFRNLQFDWWVELKFF